MQLNQQSKGEKYIIKETARLDVITIIKITWAGLTKVFKEIIAKLLREKRFHSRSFYTCNHTTQQVLRVIVLNSQEKGKKKERPVIFLHDLY